MKALVLKGFATRSMSCHAGQTIDVDGALLEDLKGAKYIKTITAEAKPTTAKKAPRKKVTKT